MTQTIEVDGLIMIIGLGNPVRAAKKPSDMLERNKAQTPQ